MNYIANILTWLEKADSGFNWYFDTHDWVKSLPGDLMQNCGLVAAFSCNTAWEHNKRCTVDYLKTGTTGHLGVVLRKANAIVATKTKEEILAILNGQKIQNFFLNILDPSDPQPVTIDRHAFLIATNGVKGAMQDKKINKGDYQRVAQAYRDVAYVEKLIPNQVQAATWIKFITC